MATAIYTDFKIYEDEYYGGLVDMLQQNTNAFNGASNGALRLVPDASLGNFQKEAFWDSISNLVTRRDVTSTSAATAVKPTSDELIRPKVSRKIGPIETTDDALARVGYDMAQFSYNLGQQVAKARSVDQVNTLLKCAVAAMSAAGYSAAVTDKSGAATPTLIIEHLIAARALYGDAFQNIAAWVMHSKPFHDLTASQADIACDSVAGATIYRGSVGTLGLPVVVLDSPALINADGITSGTDSYYTLGLTAGAAEAKDVRDVTPVADLITGLENLTWRIQGEYDYLVGMKGFAYNQTGVNPADAALATASNWSFKMGDIKSGPGVVLETA